MKKVALILLTVLLGVNAFASDQMEDEIVCNKVHQPGSADDGLTIVLKSNETAWIKMVDVIENGYIGPRLIGSIQVPLQPKLVPVEDNGTFNQLNMVYEGNGLKLSIEAFEKESEPLPLTGVGLVNLALPGYPEETVDLTCEYAN